jgi:hypothetical protein
MSHQFDDRSAVHVHRDIHGVARDLLHVEEPYISTAGTPQLAAREYLDKFGPLLGITHKQLDHLGLVPEAVPIDAPVEYRFLDEKVQFDTIALVFSQTCLGLPVRGAGLTINMRRDPLQILSAQSALHTDLDVTHPGERAVTRLQRLDAKSLARHLGIAEDSRGFEAGSLRINSVRLIVYRYDKSRRQPREEPTPVHRGQGLTLPLPPLPESIEHGHHYVAAEIVFVLSTEHIPDLHWIGIVEAKTQAVLFVQPLIDDVDGLVFRNDPVTEAGGPPPNATNAQLNPVRAAAWTFATGRGQLRADRRVHSVAGLSAATGRPTARAGRHRLRLRRANRQFRRC